MRRTTSPGRPRASLIPFPNQQVALRGTLCPSMPCIALSTHARAGLRSRLCPRRPGPAHMSCESLSFCLSRLSAATEDPAGLSQALSSLRSRHVSRAGGAELFRRRGGLPLLLALFTEPPRAAVLGTSRRNLELALSLLANSCTEPGSRVQVRHLGGIPALVGILQSVCVDSVWNRVCRALGNLALDPRNCLTIHQSGAVSSIIHILQSSQDAGCLQSCLRALRILGDSHSHRLSICEQGGLAPCASLLSSAEPALVCAAVRATCELSRGCSLDCAEQLSPAVPALVLLVGGAEVKPAVRQAALGTLCNLCGQGALRPMLGNAGMVQLLMSEVVLQRAAPTRCLPFLKALCLCCREALNRRRVREMGGLELMLGFLRDPQYCSLHSRIIAAFLHFCHDTAALTLLGSGGLAVLLAQRLEELARTADALGVVPETKVMAEEEEDKASTSFDFPPEPRNKKLQDVPSEDSLRSWLLSEGYICSLDELPPEWHLEAGSRGPRVSDECAVSGTVSSALPRRSSSTNSASSRSGKEIQLNGLSGVEQRPTFSPTSSKPDIPTASPLTCQSPLQEILGSPWPLGPRSPLPAEVFGPEFPGLLLLSRFSQLSDPSSSLVCPQVFKGLLTYVTCHPHPSPRAARLLQRLTCDPSCLEAFIRTGIICTLRAKLLLCESPENNSEEYNRHPETTKELGQVLLRNLCIQAESPFGVGAVTHMLVSGPQADRQQCALCLPFIYRKDSPHRQLLLDGALCLILEPLMLCMDPVFFFHASECLCALVSPQNLPAPCLLPELVTTRCCYQDLLSERGPDVVFVLDGGERIEGNRKEVTGACEVFGAMLEGGYIESQQREVYVHEVPPCAFIPLLHYLHGCTERALCPTLRKLPVPTPGQDLAHSPLGFTLAAAGRFLLPGLQQELEKSVRESLLSLDTLPSVYYFAETHESAALRRDCCVYLLRQPHPPRKRASSLFQLCQRAQDKRRLALLLEDVVLQRN